jgi:alpha-tubulin suppressor-like RCC1 family protein
MASSSWKPGFERCGWLPLLALTACPGPQPATPLPESTTTGPSAAVARVVVAPSVAPDAEPVPSPIVALTTRCALYRDHLVRCWRPTPAIQDLVGIVELTGGDDETWAVLADGVVHCDGCEPKELETVRSLGPAEHIAYGRDTIIATKSGEVHSLHRGELERVEGLPSHPTRLTMASKTGCAFYENHVPMCWGDNAHGQLPTKTGYGVGPIEWEGLRDARALSGGFARICFVNASGETICRGDSMNDAGTLGDGKRHHQDEVEVDIPKAVDVASGFTSNCAVLADGRLMCWGRDDEMFDSPRAARGPFDTGLEGVVRVALSRRMACAARRDGSVACLGNVVSAGLQPVAEIDDAIAIAAGRDTSCAIRGSGELWCWGRWGEVAHHRPRQVHGIDDATMLALAGTAGRSYDGCVVHKTGKVTCWYDDRLSDPELDDALKVAVQHHHACALRRGGKVSCWGSQDDGALGSSVEHSDVALEVAGIADAVDVSVTGDSSCALIQGGAVWCWGDNSSGDLGLGRNTPASSSRPLRNRARDVVALAGGFHHSCAVGRRGQVACWGFNGWRETFFTSIQFQPTPLPYPGVERAQQLALGSAKSCSLDDREQLTCWGSSIGRVSDLFAPNTGIVRRVATPGAAAVRLGADHACLRTKSGAVQCWGDNSHGELGDGAGPFGARTVLEAPASGADR